MAPYSCNDVASRIFVAMDFEDAKAALLLAERLAPLGVSFKVGKQLFYAAGMPIVHQLQQFGKTVFVDLKLHDIPNTVAGAVDSLVRHGVDFLNVHTQGGPEMMAAAVAAAQKAADRQGTPRATVIGVTLLTSLSERHLREFLFVESATPQEYVQHLAMQAQKSGLDGVVCSAQEAAAIREACGPDFLLVTPGVRPAESDAQDQARVVTPAQAFAQGASHIVIGRPITGAVDPVAATRRILDEIQGAHS